MTQQISACDSHEPVYNGLTGLVSKSVGLNWFVLLHTWTYRIEPVCIRFVLEYVGLRWVCSKVELQNWVEWGPNWINPDQVNWVFVNGSTWVDLNKVSQVVLKPDNFIQEYEYVSCR